MPARGLYFRLAFVHFVHSPFQGPFLCVKIAKFLPPFLFTNSHSATYTVSVSDFQNTATATAAGTITATVTISKAAGATAADKVVFKISVSVPAPITNDICEELPVLSYQSSIRASQTRRGDFGAEMKKRMDDRRCGYLGCLDAVLDLKRIKEWCYEMQRIAYILSERRISVCIVDDNGYCISSGNIESGKE